MRTIGLRRSACLAAAWLAWISGTSAQTADDTKLAHATEILHEFTADPAEGIPAQLLERAYGIAVIPSVIRGGFLLGGRRGRGVLTVRTPEGGWSNPAFVTLTGGSIGWQFGAESTDVVLVFANERSIRNIEAGKFTIGGDATAVAGPLDKRSTKAVTLKSEVYVYAKSRGLFAGAAFEGARLDIDQEANAAFYAPPARALAAPAAGTPPSVQPLLAELQRAAAESPVPVTAAPVRHSSAQPPAETEEAVTFPLE
jgi:lipid-binding SYLF domain-containing protein